MNSPAAAEIWIKVCGLRTREAIIAASTAGAQAVGFVFHEGSPRNVSIAEAVELQQAVPPGVERIAVFLHPSQQLVDAVIAHVQPDRVQMDAVDLACVSLPAAQRTLPVLRSGCSATHAVPLPGPFLLESARSGAGEKADWSEAARLATQAQLVLAGGLDVANVAAAISTVRPFGVDVSSGVESSRGVKSPALISEFILAARAAQARLAV
jgi:phosphoribosylanthranilate isomerase